MQPQFGTRRRKPQPGNPQSRLSDHSVAMGRLSKEVAAVFLSLLWEEKHEVGGDSMGWWWEPGSGVQQIRVTFGSSLSSRLGENPEHSTELVRSSLVWACLCLCCSQLYPLFAQVPAPPAPDTHPFPPQGLCISCPLFLGQSSLTSRWFLFIPWASGKPAYPRPSNLPLSPCHLLSNICG